MPDPYRISILPEASADLIELFDSIQRDSPQNADAVIQQLFDAIDSLEQFRQRSRVHRSAKSPGKVVYAMAISSFVIYYRILTRDHVVEVPTIRRGARNQPRRFRK